MKKHLLTYLCFILLLSLDNSTIYSQQTSEALLQSAKKKYEQRDYQGARTDISTLLNGKCTPTQKTEGTALLAEIDMKILKISQVTENLRKKVDEVEELTWYYDEKTPQYLGVNNLHLYIGQRGKGTLWLILKIQSTSSNLLGIQSYKIKTDTDSYTIDTDDQVKFDVKPTVNVPYLSYLEWYDVYVTPDIYEMVKDIATSQKAILRSVGMDYYRDRTISEDEKQALRNILDAYAALGGPLAK